MLEAGRIAEIKRRALEALSKGADALADLDAVRVRFLGKKGELTEISRSMGKIPAAERPQVGQWVNEARNEIEHRLADLRSSLKEKVLTQKLESERLDVTLPGRQAPQGHLHPLTLTLHHVKEFFRAMGYRVEEGPEIERDHYNFEALNLPKDHPARDMQDSFYITEEILMRTHTSPVQARTLEKQKPNTPVRMIAPGRVYRRDDYDATHSPMFTQVEGLVVDKDIRFSDLKGTLEIFLREMFGKKAGVRFRPSFFPFTEPSTEVDISCVMCHGTGCRVCKGTGWLEILGAGMVHPNVLTMGGYDPKIVQGFAFGMGIERIAMLTYGIDDLRLFYDNDVRFLQQF